MASISGRLASCVLIVSLLCTDGQMTVLSETEELAADLNVFDGRSFNLQQSPDGVPETMLLDNRLMREMYRISTANVYTIGDIRRMISAVASKPGLKLNDAVTLIVNLKLIEKLQFRVMDSMFAGCTDLDRPHASNDTLHKHISRNGWLSLDTENEPACITKFDELSSHHHSEENNTEKPFCLNFSLLHMH